MGWMLLSLRPTLAEVSSNPFAIMMSRDYLPMPVLSIYSGASRHFGKSCFRSDRFDGPAQSWHRTRCTPGRVEVLSSTLSAISVNSDSFREKVVEFALGMPKGDVLLVGPILSQGTANAGKLVAGTAAALELDVGGKREGGAIYVLLDGPREGLVLEQEDIP
jgi:hypothetical protein